MKKLLLLLLLPLCSFGQSGNVDGSLKTVTATGTNSYVISGELLPTSYDPHERFIVIFTNGNTGASTLKRGSLAALPLQFPGGVDLVSGVIQAGERRLVSCTGTTYQLLSTYNLFTRLLDGPGSFGGNTLNYSRVNIGGTALEYRTPSQVLSDIGGQSALTFNNGLTNSSGTVQLGGTLTQNTTINGNGFDLNFGTLATNSPLNHFNVFTGNFGTLNYSYIQLSTGSAIYGFNSSAGVSTGQITMDVNGSTIQGRNSSTVTEIRAGVNSSGSLYVKDNRTGGNQTGLQEFADYSSGYTGLSYTNKNYVDSHLIGLTFTNSPSNGYISQYNGVNHTWVSPASSIPNGSITLAKMANLPANTVIGNNTGISATPLALTQSQLTAMVNNFSSSASGAVPQSTGNVTPVNFLREDGSWLQPMSVTSYTGSLSATAVSNINSISTGASWYMTDSNGSFYNFYATFDVYASTSGAWGNVVFDFNVPFGVTWSSSNQVVGIVSGVYTGSATTPISGIVQSKSGDTKLRCTFTSFNSVNAYRVYVNVFYHP